MSVAIEEYSEEEETWAVRIMLSAEFNAVPPYKDWILESARDYNSN